MTFYELEEARDYAFTKMADTRVGTDEWKEAFEEYLKIDDDYQRVKRKIDKELSLKRKARVS